MELSNILTYAKDLKSLLVTYDNAVKELTLIETKIQRLDQQIFSANMEGHQGYTVRLQTQKSVVTGMKKVYNRLKTKKWQEIQELSTLILQSHDQNQPSPDLPNPVVPMETDTMATSITEFYCAFSRMV